MKSWGGTRKFITESSSGSFGRKIFPPRRPVCVWSNWVRARFPFLFPRFSGGKITFFDCSLLAAVVRSSSTSPPPDWNGKSLSIVPRFLIARANLDERFLQEVGIDCVLYWGMFFQSFSSFDSISATGSERIYPLSLGRLGSALCWGVFFFQLFWWRKEQH